jgi:acetoin utilization protein AcuB
MATSLSIYELNYLMSKTKVETVMVKNVITVKDYDLVETATERMLTNDIGCLPVVNDDNEVVGIVTQNDVFSTFLTMLGWGHKGARITVSVKDEIGTVGKLSKIFVDQNINIQSIGVYPQEDGTSDLLIRCDSVVNDELMKALEDAGMKINEVYKNE